MSGKAILLFCAQALLAQTISAYYGAGLAYDAPFFAAPYGAGLAYEAPLIAGAPCGAIAAAPCGIATPYAGFGLAGYDACGIAASNGGGFPTSSASPIPPLGVSVLSENEIGGVLAVGGELPFLGTVGLEGLVPTAGAGAVAYGCGNGAVGMVSEDIAGPGLAYPAAGWGYGPALATGFGYGPGLAGRAYGGCGCGLY